MKDADQYQRELDVIDSVEGKSASTKFLAYAKISGPGWLQGAITLGGGSLAGALFLGVIAGYSLLWVQPVAMICGIIMLSAIAYVTLSTGERPLRAINQHLHPLLGWSWLVATVMANIVWVMPQFALGVGAIEENLFGAEFGKGATYLVITLLFALGLFVNYLYESGGKSAKTFDLIIKIMVGIIVLCFFAVVVSLLMSGKLPLGQIFSGFLPNPMGLANLSPELEAEVAQSSNPGWWKDQLLGAQRDRAFTAFGTAVGINMTFLLPYTLLKKKWGPRHRGLSITDLSIGLFVPFFLATTCVVIASAASFQGNAEGLDMAKVLEKAALVPAAEGVTTEQLATDVRLAPNLISRNQSALATTLEPAVGSFVAQKIFGIGVIGMAVSTIIILMLINGLAFQEILSDSRARDRAASEAALSNKKNFFIGCLISGAAGFLFPLLWTGDSKAAFAVPTSVIGGSLIPIAYFTFFLLMNSKKVLGDKRPEGTARLIWNVLMGIATITATAGSVWATWPKKFGDIPAGKIGTAFLVVLFVVGTVSFLKKEKA